MAAVSTKRTFTDRQDSVGQTPLHKAAALGDLEEVKRHERYRDRRDLLGQLPIILALRNRCYMERLLPLGGSRAILEEPLSARNRYLMNCLRAGNERFVHLLVELGKPGSATPQDLFQPLHVWEAEGRESMILAARIYLAKAYEYLFSQPAAIAKPASDLFRWAIENIERVTCEPQHFKVLRILAIAKRILKTPSESLSDSKHRKMIPLFVHSESMDSGMDLCDVAEDWEEMIGKANREDGVDAKPQNQLKAVLHVCNCLRKGKKYTEPRNVQVLIKTGSGSVQGFLIMVYDDRIPEDFTQKIWRPTVLLLTSAPWNIQSSIEADERAAGVGSLAMEEAMDLSIQQTFGVKTATPERAVQELLHEGGRGLEIDEPLDEATPFYKKLGCVEHSKKGDLDRDDRNSHLPRNQFYQFLASDNAGRGYIALPRKLPEVRTPAEINGAVGSDD